MGNLPKDIIRYSPSKGIPAIFGMLIISVLTRLFNSNEYGQYTIVISTISILSIIAVDWIGPSIIRFYAEYKSNLREDMFNGTIVRITASSIAIVWTTSFILLHCLRPYFTSTIYYYLNIGLLILVFGAMFSAMLQILVVKGKANQYSFFTIWRQCVCLLLGITLVSTCKLRIDGLLWGIVFGILGILPFLYKAAFKRISIRSFSKSLCIDMIRYGFPLVATNLSSWILALSDRYVIQFFRGSHEVGLYSISYGLTERSIQLIITIIILASSPVAMEVWAKNKIDETRRYVSDLTKLYLIIAVPAFVGLSTLSEPIVKLFATESFHEGHKIVPMVATSVFLFGLQRNFQLGLLFYKQTKWIMYIVLFSGLTNLVLNVIFVPKFGFVAAGYTTLASYIVFTILVIAVSRRYFVWRFPFNTLYKVIFSTALMYGVVVYITGKTESIWVTITFSVVIGGFVYLFLMAVLKVVDRNFFINLSQYSKN